MKKMNAVKVLILMIAAVSAVAAKTGDSPVVVTETREIGISASDESKSVIQIKWQANPAAGEIHGAFRLYLAVTYADGSTVVVTRVADSESGSVRIEVPSTRISWRNPPASIKSLRAFGAALDPKRRQ